jgi:outer membrane protein TolC
MRKILMALIMLTASQLVFSQQKIDLTIEKAIDLALKNNRNYMISKEQVKQYAHRVRQNMAFLPNVSVQGIKNLDEKLMEIEIPSFIPGGEATRAKLDFTLNYEFTFQVVQPIFAGGKILYSYKNAKLDLNIAKEKRKNAREEMILNVKKVFFNILVMKELLKAHKEALALAETNYNNINENYKLGMVSKYDLLSAELAVSAVKPNILQVKKFLDLSILNLKFMTGIPDESSIDVNGKLTYDRHELEEVELIKKSLVNRSEILQLGMEKKKAANFLKIAYGNFLPTLSIVGGFSYRSNNFNFKGSNWEDYYSINLAVDYPIFTGLKRSAQVGETRVIRKILDLRYKELNDATKLQVQNLVMTIKTEHENIQTGLKNIETAKEGVRIAELTYSEGLISILELNVSYNALTRAKVNFFQAVYNYNIALAQLEKISGVKINK